jgi:hypothetical protein
MQDRLKKLLRLLIVGGCFGFPAVMPKQLGRQQPREPGIILPVEFYEQLSDITFELDDNLPLSDYMFFNDDYDDGRSGEHGFFFEYERLYVSVTRSAS